MLPASNFNFLLIIQMMFFFLEKSQYSKLQQQNHTHSGNNLHFISTITLVVIICQKVIYKHICNFFLERGCRVLAYAFKKLWHTQLRSKHLYNNSKYRKIETKIIIFQILVQSCINKIIKRRT